MRVIPPTKHLQVGSALALVFLLFVNQAHAGWKQDQKLVASDPQYWGVFGCSVAIDGNTAVIGASGTEYTGKSTGSAYIFTYDGNR
ncbi:MAG: FG-GAP repeat protein [Planctomycetota bacterium]